MNRSLPLYVLGAMCLGAFASAQNLKYTGTDLDNPRTVSIRVGGNGPSNVKAGKLTFTDGSNTIETYCADALSFLNSAFHGYTSLIVDTNAGDNLSKAGRIIAKHFDTASSRDQQAGLQLAIWSALYDGATSFTADGSVFKVTGATNSTLDYAHSYYQAINHPADPMKQVTLLSSNANGAQSQLTVATVPEPMTMSALGLGVVALMRRRRK